MISQFFAMRAGAAQLRHLTLTIYAGGAPAQPDPRHTFLGCQECHEAAAGFPSSETLQVLSSADDNKHPASRIHRHSRDPSEIVRCIEARRRYDGDRLK